MQAARESSLLAASRDSKIPAIGQCVTLPRALLTLWHEPCESSSNQKLLRWSIFMKRRDFLKSATGLAAGAALPAMPSLVTSAQADARSETLLIVSEGGPNNLDIHGVGTNVPGYEVSWNCYDRLISHQMKTLATGVQYYERDKFKMELADDMKIGDMSVTFTLKKNATFHDGTPITAKDVKWS